MPPLPIPSPARVAPAPHKSKHPRNARGQLQKGHAGFPAATANDAARARRALNSRFLAAMTEAFDRGGRQAIDKVMKQQPAIFVKMLTLLVPRELEVTHSNTIKQMSDEQIEAAIEHIQRLIEARASGAAAKVIEGELVGGDMGTATRTPNNR